MRKYFLAALFFFISGIANRIQGQVSGCTDPQANNYNASATVNNGSCTYNVTNLALTDKTPLSTPLLDETSGLEFLSGKLWSFGDSGNPNAIYRIDTASNAVHQTVTISNATNTDWEDMTSSNDHLFIGDFGNNNGNRQNLRIYRIHKNNLGAGVTSAIAEIINFSYSDQTSFPSLPNNNNFDCEAMIFYNDSLHLFSKNWVDKQTRHYVLPNLPGTRVAQYRETLNTGYLVTSASVQKGGVIALIGYDKSGTFPVYVHMLYDHKNNFFFNGNKRRFNLSDMFTNGQVEGVEFFNAAYAFITNERYVNGNTVVPKLKTFNLAPYLPNAFVYPKPKPVFTANTTSICANASVTFTDQSENDPTSWQWSFPGGSPATSGLQNPVVQYASAGTYNVTLIATNATGSDTLVKTNYITVNAKPSPSISGTLSFCSGSSTSLNAGAGYSSYAWSTGATTQSINVTTTGTFTVTVTNANGCSGSTTATTTINANPTPSISGALSFCSGSSTTLNAGAGHSSYLWSTGATTQSINVSTAGTFTVTVTNANGCTGSTTAITTINANPTPSISGALSFCSGSSTVLDAGAGYSAYSWSTGAPSQSITVSSAGSFTVTVTNGNNCTGTASVTTTVNSLPSATTTPNGTVVTCNASQTLTANSGAGLGYQWTLNGSNINGATGISYNATSNGDYAVVVTQSGCSSTSATVNLALGTGAVATITGPTSFCAGSAITLTSNTGSGITYQWYRNSVIISGATLSTYSVNNAGTFYVRENSSCGVAQSNSIVVSQINNPNPTISYNSPLSFCAPGSVLLTANSYAGVTYQWQKNGTDVAGATNQTYSATTNGTYRVRQTANGCSKYGTAVSTTTATSVTAAITADGPVTFCTGGSVVLSITGAVPGYSYQWKNNSVNVAGATASSYTASAAGSFTCTVTANCGTSTSNIIQVSTGGITASIVPSGSVAICSGGTAALSANTGTGYAYQWYMNGNIVNGATSSAYNATAAGSYTVFITSPCGNATSAATTVSIAAVTAAMTPAGSVTICAGGAQTFTANTGFNYTYKWFRNGVEQAGATGSTYSNSSYGTYTVRVTQGGTCSATSAATQLIVTTNPTPTITAGGPTTFCAGQNVVLSSNTYAGVTLQWQKNSSNIAGATHASYVATTAGAYSVTQTANGCSRKSPGIAVTVNCREASMDILSFTSNDKPSARIFPNPFRDELQFSGFEFKTGDKVQLINMLGEVVLSENISGAATDFRLLVSDLQAGIYLVKIDLQNNKTVFRVVKQ